MSHSVANEDRIARLEKKVRTLAVCLAVLPVVCVLLGAAASDLVRAKSVTTEKLVILDADGKERAAIFCNAKQEPVLELYNSDHSLILNAGRSPDNGVGFIQFFDSAGKFKGGVGGNAVK